MDGLGLMVVKALYSLRSARLEIVSGTDLHVLVHPIYTVWFMGHIGLYPVFFNDKP